MILAKEALRTRTKKALVFALFIGFLGAVYLADNVKKAMFGMEPIEIATLVEEKQAILGSIREGIIFINKDGIITVTNKEARRLLGINTDIIGMPITEVIPNTRLPEVLKTGKAEYDQDQLFCNNRVLTSRVPVVLKNRVVGAVASFRDMTDIQKLAEELTGVQKYVDALRAQSHEFKNRIHTIAGLLQLGEYEEAVELIIEVSGKHQDMVDALGEKIKDPLIGGLLLGKLAVANEMGIEVEKVHVIEQINQETRSLEQPVGDDEDKSTFGEFIPDDKILRPDQEASRRMLQDAIRSVLEEISPKEKRILEMRYGLLDGVQHTLEEVGKEFGVTRERIRQIEAKVHEKLRQNDRIQRLRNYFD